MPYTVQNLIEERPDPVSVNLNDSVSKAYQIMLKMDFSQLPVVDHEKKPQGLITFESILRTINILKVEMSALSVIDVLVKTEKFQPEDDLFELLDRLKDSNAVLVVDNNGTLKDIVTSYDTNEFFRRRSEDIMLLEDIESMLKELIMAAHLDEKSGQVDMNRLAQAINEVANPVEKLRKQYEKALKKYMSLNGDPKFKIDAAHFNSSFSAFEIKDKPPEFERLTLYEYNVLLIKNWEYYSSKFTLGMKPEIIAKLLDEVRNSRNQLAHFRGVLTQEQREQMHYCAEWLTRHQVPSIVPESESTQVDGGGMVGIEKELPDEAGISHEIIPIDEETSQASRYYRLAEYLSSIPREQTSVRLSLTDVEQIIQGKLPPTAYSHRSWWANDSVGHVQSKQWLEVDWRVSTINLTEGIVTFVRIVDRQKAYIHFFNKILKQLEKRKTFPLKQASPDGTSWVVAAAYPKDSSLKTYFNFSFTRNQQMRIELYIDTGIKAQNKAIFDRLYRLKEQLQTQIDEEIKWERIDEKRASRIALYHPGKITDSEETLNELVLWATAKMDRFFEVFAQPLAAVIKEVENDTTLK